VRRQSPGRLRVGAGCGDASVLLHNQLTILVNVTLRHPHQTFYNLLTPQLVAGAVLIYEALEIGRGSLPCACCMCIDSS